MEHYDKAYVETPMGTAEIIGDNFGIVSISVINLLGEDLMNEKIGDKTKMELDISNFSEGVYYIKLNSKDSSYLKKLILLR